MTVVTKSGARILEQEVEWIPLGKLFVDPDLQRPRDETAEQRITDNLDLNVLGVLDVSARSDGRFHVMDGQTRRNALIRFGFNENDLVPCLVSRGLTRAQEAHHFTGRNTARPVRAYDRFRIRIQAEDPIALGIDAILMEHGWRIQTGDIDGGFAAVVAAERVFTGFGSSEKGRGPQNFRSALGVITEAWGRNPGTAHGAIVAGLGLFFARYGDTVDKAALVRRLAQFPGGADALIGKARGIREFRGGVLARCVAELTVEIYNRRRSTGQLPEWRS